MVLSERGCPQPQQLGTTNGSQTSLNVIAQTDPLRLGDSRAPLKSRYRHSLP